MILIALAVAAAAPQPGLPPGISAVQQARATVRIVSGARVTAEKPPEEALVRETKVSNADGSRTASLLIEFLEDQPFKVSVTVESRPLAGTPILALLKVALPPGGRVRAGGAMVQE